MVVRAAGAQDLAPVLELLAAEGLPTDGVAPAFPRFVVVGRPPVGAAGAQLFGETALVRAVVVAPEHRRQGLGTRLMKSALDGARVAGVKRVYLVTEQPTEFLRRLGFREVPRLTVDPAILGAVDAPVATSRWLRVTL